jgi:hypothetical protein
VESTDYVGRIFFRSDVDEVAPASVASPNSPESRTVEEVASVQRSDDVRNDAGAEASGDFLSCNFWCRLKSLSLVKALPHSAHS